jgi:hypothetical protein
MWALVPVGLVLISGFGRLIVETFRAVPSAAKAIARGPRTGIWMVLPLLIGLTLAWPIVPAGDPVRFAYLYDLMIELGDLSIAIIAIALVAACWGLTRGQTSVVLDSGWRAVGVYFVAVIALNSDLSWMFVPVPLIVGAIVAQVWLFRSDREMAILADAERKGAEPGKQIQDVLDSAKGSSLLQAAQKALSAKLASAELSPQDYKDKLADYRKHFADEVEQDLIVPGVRSRDVAFARGHGRLDENVRQAVGAASLLAIGPVTIALYEYVQADLRTVYPILDVVSFLFAASAQWLLYGFFFGFFYAHLRGMSGLSKGIAFCITLIGPFLVYRLLYTQQLNELVPFFLWAAQVFLFCSLMGLSFDLQLLRDHGHRARDLQTVHNIPALSAYASTVVAAAGSAIAALLSNRLADTAKFFIDSIVGGGGA